MLAMSINLRLSRKAWATRHVPVLNQPGQDVGFHVDGRYPYEDAVGFVEHTGSVVKTIIQTIAPPKTPQ